MFSTEEETGITRNIRVIEWLKADLLTSCSALFKSMLQGSEELLLDALASLIITCYILGQRLGINFSRLDLKVESKLRQEIDEGHKLEKWYGDLSKFLDYLVNRKMRSSN